MENCYVPETYYVADDDDEQVLMKDVVEVDMLNHINIYGNLRGFIITSQNENSENLKIL